MIKPVRSAIPTTLAATLSATAVHGTNYYYDALGRQISSFRPSAQDEVYTLDSTDNRNVLNAFSNTTPAQTALLKTYQILLQGQSIVSTDGRFTLSLQQDGNLVLYQGATNLWQTGTAGRPAAYLVMRASGDLELFDPQTNLIWASNTSNQSGAYLNILNNGNMVLYSNGSIVWQTNTCCH